MFFFYFIGARRGSRKNIQCIFSKRIYLRDFLPEMTSQKFYVGFGKAQIDPWDIFRRELIDLLNTDSVICREIFSLSKAKFEKLELVEVFISFCSIIFFVYKPTQHIKGINSCQ